MNFCDQFTYQKNFVINLVSRVFFFFMFCTDNLVVV